MSILDKITNLNFLDTNLNSVSSLNLSKENKTYNFLDQITSGEQIILGNGTYEFQNIDSKYPIAFRTDGDNNIRFIGVIG